MASAPYGDFEIVVARETYGQGNVGSPDASSDQARAPIAPEHLDPFVALWSMCNALR